MYAWVESLTFHKLAGQLPHMRILPSLVGFEFTPVITYSFKMINIYLILHVSMFI